MTTCSGIVIADEPFSVEVAAGGSVRIYHRNWSIEGVGETTAEALDNLVKEAKIIELAYSRLRDDNSTPSARRLGQFVRRLLKIQR